MAGPEKWYFTREKLLNSPSRRCGLDADKELSHRQQAANLIQDMGQRLQVSQLCINTAIVYMHRFYAFHSFTHFHRNAIAAAALFLAAKVEEQPRKLEYVIKVAHMCLHRTDGAPALDVRSEHYQEQAQDLVFNENVLLQTLGFDVGIDHPHTHVLRTCQLVKAPRDLVQTSYFMASNSLHLTTMCLQHKPTVVACFCIHLASKWSNWAIPQSYEGRHWFYYVDRSVTTELLERLTAEFLHIFDKYPSRLKKRMMSLSSAAAISSPHSGITAQQPLEGQSGGQQTPLQPPVANSPFDHKRAITTDDVERFDKEFAKGHGSYGATASSGGQSASQYARQPTLPNKLDYREYREKKEREERERRAKEARGAAAAAQAAAQAAPGAQAAPAPAQPQPPAQAAAHPPRHPAPPHQHQRHRPWPARPADPNAPPLAKAPPPHRPPPEGQPPGARPPTAPAPGPGPGPVAARPPGAHHHQRRGPAPAPGAAPAPRPASSSPDGAPRHRLPSLFSPESGPAGGAPRKPAPAALPEAPARRLVAPGAAPAPAPRAPAPHRTKRPDGPPPPEPPAPHAPHPERARPRTSSASSEPELVPVVKKLEETPGYENVIRDSQRRAAIRVRPERPPPPPAAPAPSPPRVVLNGIETDPTLVSSLLKESLSKAPPSNLLTADSANFLGDKSAEARPRRPSPAADGARLLPDAAGLEPAHSHRKKKKKEKHKHKDKDKDKSREERKKHKKDKERDRRKAEPEALGALKITIPREKLATSPGEFKIKIPKERIGAPPPAPPPAAAIKIKISKRPAPPQAPPDAPPQKAPRHNGLPHRDKMGPSTPSASGIVGHRPPSLPIGNGHPTK